MNKYFLESWLLYLVALNFTLSCEGILEKIKGLGKAEIYGFNYEYDEIWICLYSFHFDIIAEFFTDSFYQLFVSTKVCSDIDSVTLTKALF